MRRLLSLMLVLILAFSFLVSASAQEIELEEHLSGDYTYVILDDNSVRIVKYAGTEENVVIPEEIDGKPVTSIAQSSFEFIDSIKTVKFPVNVYDIEGNPFLCCKSIVEFIVSPDHPYLATIDGVLFSRKDKRLISYPFAHVGVSYEIPDGIKIIGKSAFHSCDNIVGIVFPSSLMAIEDYAFMRCNGLSSVVIPDSVTKVGKGAFKGCYHVDSLVLSNSLEVIEGAAFSSCAGLKSVVISDSVKSIETMAFMGCEELESVVLPDSVKDIGNMAFVGCKKAIFTVGHDSYAKKYCEENDLKYTYTDANDWLHD